MCVAPNGSYDLAIEPVTSYVLMTRGHRQDSRQSPNRNRHPARRRRGHRFWNQILTDLTVRIRGTFRTLPHGLAGRRATTSVRVNAGRLFARAVTSRAPPPPAPVARAVTSRAPPPPAPRCARGHFANTATAGASTRCFSFEPRARGSCPSGASSRTTSPPAPRRAMSHVRAASARLVPVRGALSNIVTTVTFHVRAHAGGRRRSEPRRGERPRLQRGLGAMPLTCAASVGRS